LKKSGSLGRIVGGTRTTAGTNPTWPGRMSIAPVAARMMVAPEFTLS
jgi:hypothetical protein